MRTRLRAGTVVGVECRKRFSPLGQGEYSYDVELNIFIKMFYLLKHLSLLLLINLKSNL
jgi:hypothetical protein